MKLVGERRALASAILAFYTLLYALLALLSAVPPEFERAFYAMAGVYGLAFFALVAGYFWARWYAVGVGLYGVITSAVGLWQMGAEPAVLFMGGTHLVATLALWGNGMAQPYDGQMAWRERFHMDESAVQRLGRAVIRAGVSLPFVLLYALSPRNGAAGELAALAALGLAGVGMRALVRARAWGVVAVAAAGATLVGLALAGDVAMAVRPMLGGALLVSAAAPYAGPIARHLVRP
jgi:hypothetical protein